MSIRLCTTLKGVLQHAMVNCVVWSYPKGTMCRIFKNSFKILFNIEQAHHWMVLWTISKHVCHHIIMYMDAKPSLCARSISKTPSSHQWPCKPQMTTDWVIWPIWCSKGFFNMPWNPWTCSWYDEEAHEGLKSLMKTMMPLQRSWSPLLALDIVRWHDDVVMRSWRWT